MTLCRLCVHTCTCVCACVLTKLFHYEWVHLTGRSTINDGNSAVPIIAIIFGVELILVTGMPVILAIMFLKLYRSQMKQTKQMKQASVSESNKDLTSFN